MKNITRTVKWISSNLDKAAGFCIFLVMLLIVTNIVLRTVFHHPILGTYELVGFLTALGVSLALAHCAFQNGHIAVGFFVDKFSPRIQAAIDVVVYAVSFIFWSATVWYLGRYALAMKEKGLVSPSAEIPIYPFIYLVAFGLVGLSMVMLYKLVVSTQQVWEPISLTDRSPHGKTIETAERVAK